MPPTPVTSPDAVGPGSQTLLRLTDPLDEPEFYCIDVPGQRASVRLDAPLQAHTCKPPSNASDQLFRVDHPEQGQLFMPAYSRCLEAGTALAGGPLLLRTCSDSPLQQFVHTGEGLLKLAGGPEPGLCVASAAGAGIPAGGPSHLRRDLAMQPCHSIDLSLATWILVGP